MGMKEWYMERQMKKMSKKEKQDMMSTMMDKFFDSMSKAEKKEMMNQMMPQMMEKMFEGMDNKDKMEMMMNMMPQMMGQMFGGGNIKSSGNASKGGKGKTMAMSSMMPNMMVEMMPHCLNMMLPNVPKKKRKKFVLKMTSALMENCTGGMSEKEKKELSVKIDEKIKAHLS